MSHKDNWDRAVLHHYKLNPCALERERDRLPPMPPVKKAIVDMVIATDPDKMTDKERRALISVMAAYLDLPWSEIRIRSVTPANSSRVRFEMPSIAAKRLMKGFYERDPELLSFVSEFSPESPFTYIKDVRVVDDLDRRQQGSIVSKVGNLIGFALRGSFEDDIIVKKSSLRVVMAVAAASLAATIFLAPLVELQRTQLRSRETLA